MHNTFGAADTAAYDSIEEQNFHIRNPHLRQLNDQHFNNWFTDTDGVAFKAMPDFFDDSTKTYIEFKCHQLNTKQTKSDSESRLQKIQDFKGYLPNNDLLNNGWNHSMYKQAIVQQTLALNGEKMIVVFKDNTKLTTRNKNLMTKIGLEWLYESEYYG